MVESRISFLRRGKRSMSWMRRTTRRSASQVWSGSRNAGGFRRLDAEDLIRGDVEDAGEIGDQGAVQAEKRRVRSRIWRGRGMCARRSAAVSASAGQVAA